MTEIETNESETAVVASIAVNVAKDLAITVAGTAIGLSLFTAAGVIYGKLATRKLAKANQETVAHAMED